ncbi:hypothetical protein J6590_021635 [Homalodisca vitripennis]|nr:hypothetical protein J6590_021635 [Homalodisca vitripennis]
MSGDVNRDRLECGEEKEDQGENYGFKINKVGVRHTTCCITGLVEGCMQTFNL